MTWADINYEYKKTITVDKNRVYHTITDYPILVYKVDVDLKDVSNGGHVRSSSGFDICFYDSTETIKLKHELVGYDPITGKLYCFVKQTITPSADTIIYMYYGNVHQTTDQSTTDTWNSNYTAVYHMKDFDTSHVHDSTINANHLTKNAVNTPIESSTAKFHRSQYFDGALTTFMDAASPVVGTGAKSVIFHVKKPTDANRNVGISNSDVNEYSGITMRIRPSTWSVAFRVGNGAPVGEYFDFVSLDLYDYIRWCMYIFVCSTVADPLHPEYSFPRLHGYNEQGDHWFSGAPVGTEAAGTSNLRFGKSYSASIPYPFKGYLEEVEILNVQLMEDQVWTIMENQWYSSTFYSFGIEEVAPPLPPTPDPVYESFDPRKDIRDGISTEADIYSSGVNQKVLTFTDINGNIQQIPIYLSEETKSSNSPLPSLPLIELCLVWEKSDPQDIGADTRKNFAHVDINIYYQHNDEVDQTILGQEIADTLCNIIRLKQTQLIPGVSFVNFNGVSYIPPEVRDRQVVYHINIELEALWYN
ncbi:MAG: DUF2341 domain-containing protein [Nitrosopumilales archaeon]|nr:MAG: DUF2341 domain-containing protein [Nitrosopumilales archaeon]